VQPRKKLIDASIGYQLIGIVFAYGIGALLTIALSAIIVSAIGKNISLDSLANLDLSSPRNRQLLLILLPIQTICLFGVPAILFARACHKPASEFLGFTTKPTVSQTVLSMICILTGLYFAAYVAEWNMKLPMMKQFVEAESNVADMTKSLMAMTSFGEFLYILFAIAVLPAICEELFFRGCIQNMLTHHNSKNGAAIAIILTSVIFALMHGQMQTALARVVLGIILGLVYYFTNSIMASTFIHFLNNGLQVCLAYVGLTNKEVDNFNNNTQVNPTIAIVCLAICCIGLFGIFKLKHPFSNFKTQEENLQ
jgi:uncharacterized protein